MVIWIYSDCGSKKPLWVQKVNWSKIKDRPEWTDQRKQWEGAGVGPAMKLQYSIMGACQHTSGCLGIPSLHTKSDLSKLEAYAVCDLIRIWHYSTSSLFPCQLFIFSIISIHTFQIRQIMRLSSFKINGQSETVEIMRSIYFWSHLGPCFYIVRHDYFVVD